MAPRQGACPGAIPGNRTNLLNYEVRMQNDEVVYAARQLAQQGLQNSAYSGQHGGGLPNQKSQIANQKFPRGRGRQAMHLPCKQAYMGAVPIDSTISLRGTRLKHREEPHKLLQVGAIPTPATISSAE